MAIAASVALGICGSPLVSWVSYRSGSGRRRKSLLPFSLGEYLCCLCNGGVAGLGTKRDRKAETDTMRTAILHSCCCQKASQTISTLPLPLCLMPAILIMVTIIMTHERQSENAKPIFWRTLIRTFQSMLIGRDRTKRSLMISIVVVIAVSRIVLCSAEAPAHASQRRNSVSFRSNQVFSMVPAHKGDPQQ